MQEMQRRTTESAEVNKETGTHKRMWKGMPEQWGGAERWATGQGGRGKRTKDEDETRAERQGEMGSDWKW